MKISFGIERRRFLAQSALAGAAVRRPIWAAGPNEPVVETTHGKIRGASLDGINAFKGIPYRASTAGPNRFMPPRNPEPWAYPPW